MLITRAPRARPLAWLLLAALPALGSGPCATGSIVLGLPSAAGLLPVEIALAPGTDPAAAAVALDGADVTALFAPGGAGLVGSVPVPDAGLHTLRVTGPLLPGVPVPIGRGLRFRTPGPAPGLLEATPAAGASVLSRRLDE